MCASLASYCIDSIHCTSCILSEWKLVLCSFSARHGRSKRSASAWLMCKTKRFLKSLLSFQVELFHIFSTLLNLKFWTSTNLFISDLAVLGIHLTT